MSAGLANSPVECAGFLDFPPLPAHRKRKVDDELPKRLIVDGALMASRNCKRGGCGLNRFAPLFFFEYIPKMFFFRYSTL